MTTSESILLIGASRGLGLAMAQRYLERGRQVVATKRGDSRTALHDLRDRFGSRLVVETVDILRIEEVRGLAARLSDRRFEMVFVNAGVSNDPRETAADVATDEFARVMVTNALSPLRAVEALRGLVHPTGTIGIMPSGQGSVANNETGGREIYRASKAALNSLVRSYAARHADDGRTLLLVAPGWVRTDLGGPDAPFTIDDNVPKIIDVIEGQRGKGGLQYLDYRGEIVPW